MEAMLNGPFGRVNLGQTDVTIGRLPDNTIAINDSQSSSHHAVIRPQGQGYSITDLSSTNGTFVNDQILSPNVPRPLNSGDRIRVGTSQFTYEVAGVAPLDATMYASSAQGAGYQPTLATPQPYDNAQYAQQAPVPPPPQQQSQFQQPQLAYQGVPPYTGYASAPPPLPGYQQQPAQQRKGRRGLWIALGAIIAVILVIIIAVVAYAVFAVSTPEKTFSTYCNALKNSDYQTAYNQLSSQEQSRFSEKAFATLTAIGLSRVNGIQSCSLNNVQTNGSTATATDTVVFGNNTSSNSPIVFVNENGTWKIGATPRQSQ